MSRIKSSIKLSEIRRNKCKVSMITLSIGIKSNSGSRLQLYRSLFLFPNFAFFLISSVVRAPFLGSVIDHSKLKSALFNLGHLHHMQGNSELAASSPQDVAKNFQSPPRKKIILNICSLILTLVCLLPLLLYLVSQMPIVHSFLKSS